MTDVAQLSEPRVESGLNPSEVLKKKALRSLGSLPPFSPILNRVLASLAKENVSFSALGDLIEKDTVLTGNILHLVNSALYARRGTVNSVRHALSLLGMNKLRNAALGMSLTRMWNQVKTPASWSMARFNMHSSATAILSDMLAQRLPVDYPEGAFVAGLLHDVGQLLIAIGLPEEHGRIVKLYEKGGLSRRDCEHQLLGFAHPKLSAETLASWNLPAPIQTAVLYHHEPEQDDSRLQPGQMALSRVVSAANQYVNSIGVSILAAKAEGDASDALAMESLGLHPESLERVLEDFNAEYTSMSQFFR